MKLTTIAAKLRMTAAEMETLAALGDDLDYPVESVPPFIISWVTDPSMFSTLLRALATDKSLPLRSGELTTETSTRTETRCSGANTTPTENHRLLSKRRRRWFAQFPFGVSPSSLLPVRRRVQRGSGGSLGRGH